VHQDLARTVGNHNGLALLLVLLKHPRLIFGAKVTVEHDGHHSGP